MKVYLGSESYTIERSVDLGRGHFNNNGRNVNVVDLFSYIKKNMIVERHRLVEGVGKVLQPYSYDDFKMYLLSGIVERFVEAYVGTCRRDEHLRIMEHQSEEI